MYMHDQYLWENEEVLMANGQRKGIKHVEVGEHVMSFDPATGKMECTYSVPGLLHGYNLVRMRLLTGMLQLQDCASDNIVCICTHTFTAFMSTVNGSALRVATTRQVWPCHQLQTQRIMSSVDLNKRCS